MSRRLQLALVLLAIIFILGITGYVLIEGWSFFDSLYMTVITIATVGYSEVKPLSPYGRTFTIFLIILGMGVLLFCISTFTAFFEKFRIILRDVVDLLDLIKKSR